MPDNFRVGLVQMSTTPDPEKNLQRAIERIHDAAKRGAQIVCLPELFQKRARDNDRDRNDHCHR